MDTATKHKNKLLLLGVLVALASMAVSANLFHIQMAAPDFLEAIAAKWDLPLKPGKLIRGHFELKSLFDALK